MKIHSVLGDRFLDAAQMAAVERGEMPKPLKPLILDTRHPTLFATCDLLEGSLRYYPLSLQDVLRGDKLRAHFNCHSEDSVVTVRYDQTQLKKEIGLLQVFADEAVAKWNLLQLRTGFALAEAAPQEGRPVSFEALAAFQRSPHGFYEALKTQAPARNGPAFN